MKPQRLTDLDNDAFDALIEQHIDRTAAGANDPPIADALAAWFEHLAATTTTITVEVALTGDQLALTPTQATDQVLVRGNEIIIGDYRIVLQPVVHTEST